MIKGITDIFFDLDHTLWDFDRNSKLAFERMFITHNIEVDLKEFLKVYEPINFEYWKLYREERIDKTGLRRGRFKDAFQPFDIYFSEEQLDVLATAYVEELPKNNYLFEGVIELLDHLADKKYRMHIITNGFEEVQHLKLKSSRIDHYFETVTTSDEVGVKKPNLKVFHHALRKAKAIAHTSVMIGDTFEADILGGESAGMQTVFYNYRNERVPANYRIVDTIIDVKKFL